MLGLHADLPQKCGEIEVNPASRNLSGSEIVFVKGAPSGTFRIGSLDRFRRRGSGARSSDSLGEDNRASSELGDNTNHRLDKSKPAAPTASVGRRPIISANMPAPRDPIGRKPESPSASRSLLIEVFRPLSKSTKVSVGQIAKRNSSRVTTSPGRCTRIVRIWKGCSCNLTRTPCLRTSPARTSTSNTPKRRIAEDRDSRVMSIYPSCYRESLHLDDKVQISRRAK